MTELTLVEQEDQRLYNTVEKWYVREQWLNHARRRLATNKRNHIRYLTLTCSLVYDVLFLKNNGLIETTEIGYAKDSLAFCEQSIQRSVLIRKRLPGAKFFDGAIEDFLGVGNLNFSRRAEGWFPFDVINIDVCGSPFSERSKFTATIEKLYNAQRIKRQSFTLFITVCCAEDGDSEPNKERLRAMIRNNFTVTGFQRAYGDRYPQPIALYHEFLSLAIPKLVIDVGFQHGFDVDCKRKFTYIGGANAARMISFIFDCDMPYVPDPLMYLSTERPVRLVGVIRHEIEDVNGILQSNNTYNQRCTELQREYTVNGST